MSSVCFPAHVVVLFRRIVNVVSTISISNQYVLSTQSGLADDTFHSKTRSASSKQSFAYFRNLEWPWWTQRIDWDGITVVGEDIYGSREIRKAQGLSARDDYGMVLKASLGALNFPNWIPWRNLFSSYQREVNMPGPDDEPPPPPNRKRSEEPEKHRREPEKEPLEVPRIETPPDIVHQLLVHPALFDPIRTPRYPIVLCHGLYGFDSRGPSSFPSMRMHYWSNVLRVLRGKVGAEVIVTSVPGTGSISLRAARLDEQLQTQARGRGINFLAHSMGGLDCRHLISHIRPTEYAPLSLTTISTPHRGSPFMDWCASNIGIGKIRQQEKDHAKRRDIEEFSWHIAAEDPVPESDPESPPKSSSETSFSLSTLLLSIVDSPAYANLTSNYLNDVFNPANPDDPRVKYFSVAGRISAKSVSVWHPFWLPKMVLDGVEEKERERLKKVWELENDGQKTWDEKPPFWADESQWGNDGLVTVQSARWGEFLGTMEGCDHWEMRGARGIEFGVDLPAIPAIGLGSSPPKTSFGSTQTVQGDGWGFGDWTRFVGAWKKSNADDAAAAKAANTDKFSAEELEAQRQKMDTVSVLPPSPLLSSETSKEAQQRGRLADDLGVKSSSSTDALSVVFDWLIERVPAPKQILGRPLNSTTAVLTKTSEANGATESKATFTDKEMSAVAVSLTAGPLSSSSAPHLGPGSLPPLAAPASEMKLRMEREEKGRKKNELASKEDLERFYVALSRKMYDEGL